ncbi:MAG: hypothetical protein CVV64_05935 [Candidatus Wallbacteria bacterium HGW-Wallbacteria-1]|uniref:Uncharacterized protein n=1 Tax=Candidatus Wallbacteria bacterium HGW-Wallbacteria-1 TaxID=2013854 RepID=A0A2N1PSK6_9BACT|nr:MAG: hypothetical protein CVV64_05935 [Candidatus Wallbacteria bacterium HGW-Wallbacteria-1]
MRVRKMFLFSDSIDFRDCKTTEGKMKFSRCEFIIAAIFLFCAAFPAIGEPGDTSLYRWTVFGGANLWKPTGISHELSRDAGAVGGFGYFISERGRLGFSYSSNEVSGSYFRASDLAALNVFGKIRAGIDGPGQYSYTGEHLSLSTTSLEYLYYFDGRHDARKINPKGKNLFLKNVFPFCGMAASLSTVDYDQKWRNSAGRTLMERTRETDIYTGSLIMGADFKIDHNLSLTIKGEYSFGNERDNFDSVDYSIDPDGVFGLTSTEIFNGAKFAAADSASNGPFEIDLGGPSFSISLSHIF